MKTFKLFLAVAIVAGLLTIPCTTSFARDATLSKSNTATVQVVKKEEVKKERGVLETISSTIVNVINSVKNFFGADKPTTTEQRKTAESLQQPTKQLATASVVNPAPLELIGEQEKAEEPTDATARQTPTVTTGPSVLQEASKTLSKADVPQVQQQVQIRQPSVAPSAPASPGAIRATPTPTPVITATQSPSVMPQQVERKDDLLGLTKIEVETEKNIPEVVDDREPVIAPTEPAKQPLTLSAPAPAPSAPPRTPSGQEPAEPVVSDIREPAAKIGPVEAPKTVAIIQTPLAPVRTPSDRETTAGTRTTTTIRETPTTTTGPRVTATTPTREVVTTTTETRATATTAPTRTTTATGAVPTQIVEAAREMPPANTEPAVRPTSLTVSFEGQTITGMTINPLETFAIIDTDLRTYVVSLSGEGSTECPERPTATAARPAATQTTTETTRAGVQETVPVGTQTLSAPASVPTSDTLTQRAAPASQTLAAASTITDAASTIQQTQVISDALKTEMLAQCPTTQRLPSAATVPDSGARFITTIENGNTLAYVIGDSFQATTSTTTAGVVPTQEGSTQQNAGNAEEPTILLQPTLSVVATPDDCQATIVATVSCPETVDCSGYEINVIVMAGKTVLNDFVTKINDNTFLIAPPTAATEPVKGLSPSLSKADIEGPVTITVTAKKGGTLFDEEIVDVPNKDDIISKCIQPPTVAVTDTTYKTVGTVDGSIVDTGESNIGGGGCSLIRR